MKLKYTKNLILLLTVINFSNMKAGNPTPTYAVSNIPKALLLDANAVVRTDQMIQTIDKISESKSHVKQAITILNEKASRFRFHSISYDAYIKISNIKANVYDSNGELVSNARPSIIDASGSFDNLATDNRFWAITFPVRKYPYTIEIEYEQTNKERYIFESWQFQNDDDVAVEQSGAQISIKKGIGFKVYEKDLTHPCDTFTLEDRTVYTWQEENIPAKKIEDLLMISFQSKKPTLHVAPDEFTMNGMNGSMKDWGSIGKFFYELNKDRDNISPELQAKLKQLIGSTTDKKEIIRIIYQYLQKNTRYVSIQLGIGGFQTLEASFVEKKGFGDCKALSNYMKAMLKSVNIPSYVTYISSEKDDIIASFPSDQFDHVILCVPLNQDTVWLECTNQSFPFNYLGSSNGNKHVLLLTENGGKLVKTPNYKSINNTILSNFNVNIDFIGNATVKGTIKYKGASYELPKAVMISDKETKEQYLNSIFASPNFSVKNLSFKEDTRSYPSLAINCELTVRDYVSKTPKRIVFNPYLFEPSAYMPKKEKMDFMIAYSQTFLDTVTFNLPFGYKPEFIPAPLKHQSQFGNFSYDFNMVQDKLIVTRKFEFMEKKFTREDYEGCIDFFNPLASTERQLVVLKKE